MRIMVVWLQNFQGGQSPSKYPTYVVRFMISPQMRFSWPKKWEKLSFSNEKMVVWLQNFWGGLSSSKYTILNHFWLGQLKPPRLTQCNTIWVPTAGMSKSGSVEIIQILEPTIPRIPGCPYRRRPSPSQEKWVSLIYQTCITANINIITLHLFLSTISILTVIYISTGVFPPQ